MLRLEKLLTRVKVKKTTEDEFMSYYGGYYNSTQAPQPTMEAFGLGDYRRICEALEIDTSFILRVLAGLKSRVLNKGLDNGQLEKVLNAGFAKYNIVFKPGKGNSDYISQIISAAAVTDGQIEILYAKDFSQVFEDELAWEDLKDVLTRFISHELVHRGQFTAVKKQAGKKFDKMINTLLAKDTDQAKAYLSNALELDAFAREAVQEFRNAGYKDSQILRRVNNPHGMSVEPDTTESTIYTTYMDYFAGDKVFTRFLNCMRSYLL